MRKLTEYMGESLNQEHPPLGCGHVATSGPRKRGFSRVFAAWVKLLGERLLPQSFYDLPPLVFPYKYQFQQRKEGED